MIYTFTCVRSEIRHTYDLDLSRDLDARKLASENQTCICVETQSGRVVWRKPLSPSEFRDVMTGARSGGRTRKERLVKRPFAMPGLQGDLTEWLDREKEK